MSDAIEILKECGKFGEVAVLVATFTGYRGTHEVRVEVFEQRLPGNLRGQFYAVAKDDDRKESTSNHASTVELALLGLHWENLSPAK